MNDRNILKCAVLDSGIDREYKTAHRQAFEGDFGAVERFLRRYGFEVFSVCRNFLRSEIGRTRRCKDKIGDCVISGRAYFVTLTFKDSVLASTSRETRRRYASRSLKAESLCYVGNIDFGGKTDREHYHALVQADKRPTFDWWVDHCGFVKVEKIGNTAEDLMKVAKYTTKLSRHALKKSTETGQPKAPRLIYSRKSN